MLFRSLKLGYRIWISTNFSVVNNKLFWKTCKKVFTYQVWRKSFEPFLRYTLLVSFWIWSAPLLVLWFSPKPKNNIYTFIWYVVKNWCFYLYYFWRYIALNVPHAPYAHIHMHVTNYKNHFFELKESQNFDWKQYLYYLTVVR